MNGQAVALRQALAARRRSERTVDHLHRKSFSRSASKQIASLDPPENVTLGRLESQQHFFSSIALIPNYYGHLGVNLSFLRRYLARVVCDGENKEARQVVSPAYSTTP